MSKFTIQDLTFEPDGAYIVADIRNGQVEWAISIEAALKEINGSPWKPRAYSEQLFALESSALVRWQDALSNTVEWRECYDASAGRANAALYVVEHNDIYNSKMEFAPQSGRVVSVQWTALCSVFFGGYRDDLKLNIECEAIFKGVEVGEIGEMIDEREANRRLRNFISEGEFEYLPPIDSYDLPLMMPRA